MDAGDRTAWLALFTPNAILTDDGSEEDFIRWSDSKIFSKEEVRLISIDREENNGLTLYGTLHSAKWGTFKTFFKFHRDGDKFSGLDVGQINEE